MLHDLINLRAPSYLFLIKLTYKNNQSLSIWYTLLKLSYTTPNPVPKLNASFTRAETAMQGDTKITISQDA